METPDFPVNLAIHQDPQIRDRGILKMEISNIEKEYLIRSLLESSRDALRAFSGLRERARDESLRAAGELAGAASSKEPHNPDFPEEFNTNYEAAWDAFWQQRCVAPDRGLGALPNRVAQCGFLRAAEVAALDLACALIAAEKSGCRPPGDDTYCRDFNPSRSAIESWLKLEPVGPLLDDIY